MNNLDEDIKIVEEIIKCDGCRFATCEQCEINWTQVNAIKNVLSELETYKKIAEKLAHYIWQYDCCEYEIGKNGKCEGYYIDKDCTEKCIIDWARNEVLKDE